MSDGFDTVKDEVLKDYIRKVFDKCLNDLDLTSTPGNCDLSKYGTNLAEALGHNGLHFNKSRVEIFWRLVWDRIVNSLLCDSDDHFVPYSYDCADDIKLFIKREPHKKTKIEQHKERLISGVSVVDTMIDRILYTPMLKKLDANQFSTGLMIGWSIDNWGFGQLDKSIPGQRLMADKGSYDWTVTGWMKTMQLELKLRLHSGWPWWWRKLAVHRASMLYCYPVFRTSDGRRFLQREVIGSGIEKSGSLLTIFENSTGQLILHILSRDRAGLDCPYPFCMGDDTVQAAFDHDDMESYFKEMERFGAIVKWDVSDDIEFAGMKINCNGFYPLYRGKHVFHLEHLDESVSSETLDSYQRVYAFDNNMLSLIHRFMRQRNLDTIISAETLRHQALGL